MYSPSRQAPRLKNHARATGYPGRAASCGPPLTRLAATRRHPRERRSLDPGPAAWRSRAFLKEPASRRAFAPGPGPDKNGVRPSQSHKGADLPGPSTVAAHLECNSPAGAGRWAQWPEGREDDTPANRATVDRKFLASPFFACTSSSAPSARGLVQPV